MFVLLFASSLVTYIPAIHGDKVWDDVYLIGTNEFFRSPLFVLEVFRHYLYPESFSLYYRPVQNISYIVDYWLWNDEIVGYHLSNILFHALSAFLLYVVLLSVLPGRDGSFEEQREARNRFLVSLLVALVWAVHPVHHAAVAYIAGRADSLATMFSLGAWLLFLSAREWRSVMARVAGLVVVLLLAVFALCSKEIAITWMAVFVVWTLFFDVGSRGRGKSVAIGGVILVLLTYWAIRQLPEARNAAPGPSGEPFPQRLILVFRALGDYWKILFLPTELHMERSILGEAPLASWRGFFDCSGLAPIGLGVGAIIVTLCFWKVPGRKVRILGAIWFLIGFLPISNFVPLHATVAEHWIYMASIGAILFVSGCVIALPLRFHRIAGFAAAAVIVAFSIRTAFKVRDWTSNERLFSKTIEATGGSARMSMNLAVIHLKKEEIKAAETLLRGALQRFPDAEPIRIKLASVLLSQGQIEEADFLLNVDTNPGDINSPGYIAMWNEPIIRAKLLHAKGLSGDAIEILTDAEQQFPHIWVLRAYHARILDEIVGPRAAIALVEEYTSDHWWCYPGYMLLGSLRARIGNLRSAIEAFEKASKLDINAAAPFLDIAEIQAVHGNLEATEAAVEEALRRDPAANVTHVLKRLTAANVQK